MEHLREFEMKIYEIRVWDKGKWIYSYDKEKYKKISEVIYKSLFKESEVAICSYISRNKIITKAMYVVKRNAYSTLWFNTDSTAELTQNIKDTMRATVYMFNSEIKSLMLLGTMTVEKDYKIREEVWKPEFDDWYIGGISCNDFQVIKFEAYEGYVFYDGMLIKLRK